MRSADSPGRTAIRLRSVTWRTLLWAIAIASLASWWVRAVVRPLSVVEDLAWGDFGTFYMAGYCALRGYDLYDLRHTQALASELGARKGPPLLPYPPHVALLFAPVAAVMSPTAAATASVFCNAALYWLAVIVSCTLVSRRSLDTLAVGIVAASWYDPSRETISAGQIDILAMTCIALGLMAFARGRHAWCGALFGAGAVVKLIPGLGAGYFALRRKTSALAAMILVLAVMIGLAVGFIGLGQHTRYVTREIPAGTSRINAGNFDVSLKSFCHRVLFATSDPRHPPSPQAALRPTLAFSALFVMATLVLIVFPRKDSVETGLARLSLLVVLGLIVNAWTWTHHLVSALPALAVGARGMRDSTGKRRVVGMAALCLAYGFMAMSTHVPRFPVRNVLARELLMSSSVNFYGLVLLWTILAWHIVREARRGI